MNITQLKQGSLNGLRKQINECLDNAYNKGYEDGAKNQDEVQYKKGFEDGNKIADKDLKEIQDSTYDVAYNKGYNTAINDYNVMIQWLHDCTDDFKKFINTEYGYGINYVTNPRVDEGVILYDLICDRDIAEVISEFKKRQEKKKQAEEEIKVGNLVYYGEEMIKGIVLDITNYQGTLRAVLYNENGLVIANKDLSELKLIKSTNIVNDLKTIFNLEVLDLQTVFESED